MQEVSCIIPSDRTLSPTPQNSGIIRLISSKDSQKYKWTGLHYCDRYSLILLKG
ncbi:MAG: hypothetical protein ACYT04_46145 [Nostoc sp.]